MRIKLGRPMKLGEIARAIGAISQNQRTDLITHISTDTRDIRPGDLFWALSGERYNGESYTTEARRIGCYTLSIKEDADVKVADTANALLMLASYYKKELPNLLYTVGITGSVGKSTTKEFLKEILAATYKVSATEGNYNNSIGMPMTMLSAPQDTEILILEMGMNHRGEISALSRCAKPDLGIITKIGTSHIGLLGSRENIALAKSELLDGMSGGAVAIPYGEPLLAGLESAVTFSAISESADVLIKRRKDGKINIITKEGTAVSVPFGIYGTHFEECLGAAVAISKEICSCSEKIIKGVCKISNKNIRQNIIFAGDLRIFDDSYNASSESVIADFELVSSLYRKAGASVLIGTVLELGEHSKDIHYGIGLSASEYEFRRLFFIGEYADVMAEGAISGGFDRDKIFINKDHEKPEITAQQIIAEHISGETLLFKASNKIKLYRITELIKKHFGENDNG